MESVPKRKLPQYNPSVTSAFAAVGDGSQPPGAVPNRRGRFPTAGGGSQPLATAPSRATSTTGEANADSKPLLKPPL